MVQYVRILLACGFYLAIGPSLILINRTILKERGFNYPMMLSGLGLLFSTAVCHSEKVFGSTCSL